MTAWPIPSQALLSFSLYLGQGQLAGRLDLAHPCNLSWQRVQLTALAEGRGSKWSRQGSVGVRGAGPRTLEPQGLQGLVKCLLCAGWSLRDTYSNPGGSRYNDGGEL